MRVLISFDGTEFTAKLSKSWKSISELKNDLKSVNLQADFAPEFKKQFESLLPGINSKTILDEGGISHFANNYLRPGGQTPLQDLHEAYSIWAKRNGSIPISKMKLSSELSRLGITKTRSKKYGVLFSTLLTFDMLNDMHSGSEIPLYQCPKYVMPDAFVRRYVKKDSEYNEACRLAHHSTKNSTINSSKMYKYRFNKYLEDRALPRWYV